MGSIVLSAFSNADKYARTLHWASGVDSLAVRQTTNKAKGIYFNLSLCLYANRNASG